MQHTTVECKRCAFVKRDRQRCKRNTCKYADMCWQHTRITKGLEVKRSTVPGAGLGLFTTRDIPRTRRGVDVGIYKGNDISKTEYDASDGQYGIQINPTTVRDARSTQSSIMRYANMCRVSDRPHCTQNNARYVHDRRGQHTIKIRTLPNTPVRAGSEIFVSYGRDYWR